jgi:hypothetical protein
MNVEKATNNIAEGVHLVKRVNDATLGNKKADHAATKAAILTRVNPVNYIRSLRGLDAPVGLQAERNAKAAKKAVMVHGLINEGWNIAKEKLAGDPEESEESEGNNFSIFSKDYYVIAGSFKLDETPHLYGPFGSDANAKKFMADHRGDFDDEIYVHAKSETIKELHKVMSYDYVLRRTDHLKKIVANDIARKEYDKWAKTDNGRSILSDANKAAVGGAIIGGVIGGAIGAGTGYLTKIVDYMDNPVVTKDDTKVSAIGGAVIGGLTGIVAGAKLARDKKIEQSKEGSDLIKKINYLSDKL